MRVTTKYSKNWQSTAIPLTSSVREALGAINKSGLLMACIVDDKGALLGILTDSDIRKALLNGANLEDKAINWANKKPKTARPDLERQDLLSVCTKQGIRELPLIDEQGRLQDIFIVALFDTRRQDGSTPTTSSSATLPNAMFILAGGQGTRLRPVVSDRPKSLAIIGDRPILETIILRAARAGIREFFISVNYMAEQIEEHLRSDVYKGLKIEIVREKDSLGTAGSIGYIKDKIRQPLLVCNSDVLTTAPLEKIIETHAKDRADITCVIRPHHIRVPYGVFEIQNSMVESIVEKPEYVHFVNTGIYVLNPDVCKLIEIDQRLDMPDLIKKVLRDKKRVVPFLMHEYWIDVGKPEDYHRANTEFDTHFGQAKS